MAEKSPSQLLRWAAMLGTVVATTALVACNSGSGSSSSSSAPIINGTAAIGAPIVNATINIKCADDSTYSTTSDASGYFNIGVIGDDALPCALQSSGGDPDLGAPLQSLANIAGITNITPLTDYIMAYATGMLPDIWFDSVNTASLRDISSKLADATKAVLDQLRANGFDIPADFDPLNTEFSPTAGDIYDDLLEDLMDSIQSIDDYDSVLEALAAGDLSELPMAPDHNGDGPELGCHDDCRAFLDALVDEFAGVTDQWEQNGDEVTFFVASTEGRSSDDDVPADPQPFFPGELNDEFPLSGNHLDFRLTINKTTGKITVSNQDGYEVQFDAFTEAAIFGESDHSQNADMPSNAHYAYLRFDPFMQENEADLFAMLMRGYKDVDGNETQKPAITFQMRTAWQVCQEDHGDNASCNAVFLDTNPDEIDDDAQPV